MLGLAIVCLLVAAVAFLLGFATVAGAAWAGAKALFLAFLVLFLLSAAGVTRNRRVRSGGSSPTEADRVGDAAE